MKLLILHYEIHPILYLGNKYNEWDKWSNCLHVNLFQDYISILYCTILHEVEVARFRSQGTRSYVLSG